MVFAAMFRDNQLIPSQTHGTTKVVAHKLSIAEFGDLVLSTNHHLALALSEFHIHLL
jgi:hypothetical protein